MLLREVDHLQTHAAEAATGVTTWKLDPAHTSVTFTVKHMMIANVRGEFKEASGTLQWNSEDPTASSLEVTINTASISTHDESRDTHLRSADFFDVEKHPQMTFTSKSWHMLNDGEYQVLGDLTIHGTTREVELRVEGPSEEMKDPWGGTRIAFSAAGKINRKDFGLEWNVALEAGGVLVGETVKILIDAQFVKEQ
jgi:polyisoprenoid-binding protein YceI